MSESSVFEDARRWIEQEWLWSSEIFATAKSEIESRRNGETETPLVVQARVVEDSDRRVASPVDAPFPRFFVSPSLSSKKAELDALYEKYKECVRCRLGATRIKIVFGVGSPDARVLFIGEGPGYEEDRRGEPFVGKAGQLLDKILASIGLSRQTNAYIANIVKCHPMAHPETPEARGNDRPPSPDEVETCSPILLRQIAILQPRVIVTLGSPSTRMVLRTKDGITGLRGKLIPFAVDDFYPHIAPPDQTIEDSLRERLREIHVLPTYHPAALLRNPNLKGDTWTDMKLLRDLLAS